MRISDWSSDVCSSDLSQVGVHALNARLQAAINPNPPISVGANDNDRVVIRNGHQVREGDRVICMKTNRELNVFNGDVGTVMGCEVDFENNATLLIQIGKKDVLIDRSYWINQIGRASCRERVCQYV